MTSKEKIRDIKSVINEFYHNEKCEGKLTECARKSWLVFQEYCDDILQDLERLEALEKENEKLLVNKNVAQALAVKYKKVVEILKRNLVIEFNDDLHFVHLKEDISQSCDYTIIDIEDQKEYDLLKEVLENEI